MSRRRYTAELIIAKLREAEVEHARGQTVAQLCKKIGVSEQTYYRWRKEYGGLRVDQAKRFKEIELENTRLKKPHLSPSYQREAMNKLSILNGPKLVPRTKIDVVQPQLSRYSTTFAGVVELVDT